jgi:hypothetical protein
MLPQPASPRARARSTPPFADAPRRVDNHGGACSRDDSLERVFLAPSTRARGDRADRARDARVIIDRARPPRGSRADLDERIVAWSAPVASRDRCVTMDDGVERHRSSSSIAASSDGRARARGRRSRRDRIRVVGGKEKP